MATGVDSIVVFEPRSVAEACLVYEEHPRARIFSGGTWLLSRSNGSRFPTLDREIISLRRVAELRRISRSERFLEIGATASVTDILRTGINVAPEVLRRSLASFGSIPLRNQATLGGNLLIDAFRATAFPVLMMLEAQIELRTADKARWLPIARFANPDGTLNRGDGEFCTRLRIPLVNWNLHEYRRVGSDMAPSESNISFSGVATTKKGVLADVRFCYGSMGKTIVRSRETEAALASRKIPIDDRDSEAIRVQLGLVIESLTPRLSNIQHRTALRFFDWFIRRINTQ